MTGYSISQLVIPFVIFPLFILQCVVFVAGFLNVIWYNCQAFPFIYYLRSTHADTYHRITFNGVFGERYIDPFQYFAFVFDDELIDDPEVAAFKKFARAALRRFKIIIVIFVSLLFAIGLVMACLAPWLKRI